MCKEARLCFLCCASWERDAGSAVLKTRHYHNGYFNTAIYLVFLVLDEATMIMSSDVDGIEARRK